MANIVETDNWPGWVYQYADGDVLGGGPNSSEVLPLKQLAQRSLYQRLRNVTDWDATLAASFGYPAGACVRYGSTTWRAIVANNVAPGTDAAKWERWGYSEGELDTHVITSSPPGMIGAFLRATAPTGWIKANGALISRTAYARLWAEAQVSGTLAVAEVGKMAGQYGPGDGATTFSLPDLRGAFLRSLDDGRGVDSGRAIGSWQKGTLIGYDNTTTGTGDGVWVVSTTNESTLLGSQQKVGADPYVTSDYPSAQLSGITPQVSNALPGNVVTQGASGVARPTNVALLMCIKY